MGWAEIGKEGKWSGLWVLNTGIKYVNVKFGRVTLKIFKEEEPWKLGITVIMLLISLGSVDRPVDENADD